MRFTGSHGHVCFSEIDACGREQQRIKEAYKLQHGVSSFISSLQALISILAALLGANEKEEAHLYPVPSPMPGAQILHYSYKSSLQASERIDKIECLIIIGKYRVILMIVNNTKFKKGSTVHCIV